MTSFVHIQAQNDSLSKPSIHRVSTIILDTLPILKKDTVQITTQIQKVQSKGEFIADTLVTEVLKDTVMYNPQDHHRLADLDARWKQELYSSGLFDTIYRTVTEQTYEEVVYPELSTDTLKARLARLNQRTPFNIAYNKSLESVIKSYLKNRREHLERLMGLSHFYFPLFEQELDRQNIPLEIKYLAIVESALRPRAKSRVGATGLWQFMFGTGKQFGLEVSSYVDERMDPIMATKAACKYLANLYKIFGDWDLALASYNSGPGNVTKAIRRSGGYKNYWNIRSYLPRETAGYLPAFLATMYIFEFAEEHDLQPVKPKFAYFETDTVKVKQTIRLEHVSESMNIPIEELQFLNPSYKLDIIPFVKDEDYVLRLPLEKTGTFVANESQVYALAKAEFDKQEKPLPKLFEAESKIRYRVRSGDYLGKIARKFGVRVSQLKRWNGLRSNNLRIGQRLSIFPKKPVTSSSSKVAAAKKQDFSNAKIYTVRSGDTLWSISKKFSGVSIENLKTWNNIRGSGIKPGMKLKISKS
ncbi:LysM peptidoglycan-binding domain-containing protein [Aquimarina sp. ERC-38]|uniref:lytic transglycosylase domain-containing protein n=1 Tax=Aquimarina sp. ERC-38 TaxID=2949996 RepID=UPI002245C646|nr:lytic transglycosylase domain-containing protein [Aquimarina sp. ERC-38]UZO81851.1 LysM peptidoglycan-binding domain-containing protein [Aquimarina sp. ERC-38]